MIVCVPYIRPKYQLTSLTKFTAPRANLDIQSGYLGEKKSRAGCWHYTGSAISSDEYSPRRHAPPVCYMPMGGCEWSMDWPPRMYTSIECLHSPWVFWSVQCAAVLIVARCVSASQGQTDSSLHQKQWNTHHIREQVKDSRRAETRQVNKRPAHKLTSLCWDKQ